MKGVFKMNNTNKTSCHTISGIKCEVKNCKYHDGNHCCEAGSIEVGPTSAKTISETVCQTFSAKN